MKKCLTCSVPYIYDLRTLDDWETVHIFVPRCHDEKFFSGETYDYDSLVAVLPSQDLCHFFITTSLD